MFLSMMIALPMWISLTSAASAVRSPCVQCTPLLVGDDVVWSCPEYGAGGFECRIANGDCVEVGVCP